MNVFRKMNVFWKMHIIFSSSFFGHCLKKFWAFYLSCWKFWGKVLFFLEKNIGFFYYQAFFVTRQKSFHRVYQICLVRVNGSLLRENYYFFESKHPLLSLSDIVRKISGAASGFFSAELPKLLPTCLWKQYEEYNFQRRGYTSFSLLCIKQSFLCLMAEIFREWCQKGILRVHVNRLRKPSFEK